MYNKTIVKEFGDVNYFITTFHGDLYKGISNDMVEELRYLDNVNNLSFSDHIKYTISVYNDRDYKSDLTTVDHYLYTSSFFSADNNLKTFTDTFIKNLQYSIDNFSIGKQSVDIHDYYKFIEIKLEYLISKTFKKEKTLADCNSCIFYYDKGKSCKKGLDKFVNIAGKEHHIFPSSKNCFLSKTMCKTIMDKHKIQIENEINKEIKSDDEYIEIDLNYDIKLKNSKTIKL